MTDLGGTTYFGSSVLIKLKRLLACHQQGIELNLDRPS